MKSLRCSHRVRTAGMIVAGLLVFAPVGANAQTSYACYVPDLGVVYRIRDGGTLPDDCRDPSHVEFNWTTLADGSVTTNLLADGAVTAAKLANNAVNNSKLTGNAVNSANIVDGSVTSADLASGVPVARGIAVVSASGTLLSGVNVVSVQRPSNGATAWTVTFNSNVDVSKGMYIVTPGITGTCSTAHHAEDADTLAPANSVFVGFVLVSSGTFVDCGFALFVI